MYSGHERVSRPALICWLLVLGGIFIIFLVALLAPPENGRNFRKRSEVEMMPRDHVSTVVINEQLTVTEPAQKGLHVLLETETHDHHHHHNREKATTTIAGTPKRRRKNSNQ